MAGDYRPIAARWLAAEILPAGPRGREPRQGNTEARAYVPAQAPQHGPDVQAQRPDVHAQRTTDIRRPDEAG